MANIGISQFYIFVIAHSEAVTRRASPPTIVSLFLSTLVNCFLFQFDSFCFILSPRGVFFILSNPLVRVAPDVSMCSNWNQACERLKSGTDTYPHHYSCISSDPVEQNGLKCSRTFVTEPAGGFVCEITPPCVCWGGVARPTGVSQPRWRRRDTRGVIARLSRPSQITIGNTRRQRNEARALPGCQNHQTPSPTTIFQIRTAFRQTITCLPICILIFFFNASFCIFGVRLRFLDYFILGGCRDSA